MTCERKEYLRELGMDPDIYCLNCTPNPVSGWCSGLIKINRKITTLLETQMEGFPKLMVP